MVNMSIFTMKIEGDNIGGFLKHFDLKRRETNFFVPATFLFKVNEKVAFNNEKPFEEY